METKNNKVKLETIRRRFGFDFGSYVDPEGLAGGLALWWNNDLELDIETASKNLIHTIVTDKVNSYTWAATFVYGCPTKAGKEQVWEDIKEIGRFERLPWLCMGDFNEILSCTDKLGGKSCNQQRIALFHDMLNSCGLVDLEFKGPKFTWRNNRVGRDLIMERIDMAFAESKWRELYDKALVFVEPAIGSDHNPLILNTEFPLQKVGRPFKFESFWTTEEDCRGIISASWLQRQEGPNMVKLCKKLRECKDKLKKWHRANFADLRLQISVVKDQLLEVQKQQDQGSNPELVAFERVLSRKLEDLWQKDAMFWHQRSRIKWLQMGDKNSRFFHLSTIQRRQRNQIVKLKDKDGVWTSEPKEIAATVKEHFESLFSPPPTRDFDDTLSLIEPVITPEINSSLIRPTTINKLGKVNQCPKAISNHSVVASSNLTLLS
ncbi:hypothetical protein Vadar_002675 [Vaccinium darrowii]|uniref:Uncharacterized protein n=1 Tax=Vaccinium darrowii TaxID=229202 RepID=A0ACB7Y4U4_9ERIC|nr:hypothetical protein Vadar_002675 [Vaccinium darrowii]